MARKMTAYDLARRLDSEDDREGLQDLFMEAVQRLTCQEMVEVLDSCNSSVIAKVYEAAS